MESDELRDLVATSSQRWETIVARGRAWQDRLANRDALASRGQGAPASKRAPRIARGHTQLAGADAAAIGQREQEWRLWRGGLTLTRSEFTIGRETVTVVGQGARWWRWSPVLGATSGGGVGRPTRLILGPPAVLVEAERMLEQMELVVVGSARIAGRAALLARATSTATRGRARLALREAGLGADSYELAFDEERGVLLSVEAQVGERPFQRVEVTEIDYDTQLEPTLFAPERSSDEAFVKDRAPEHLSLDSLVDAVDFTVVVPDPSPSAYPPYVALFDSDRRGFGPKHAVFTYAIVDEEHGRGQLRVTLAGRELLRSNRDRWELVNGVELCEERHGRIRRARARADMGGTYVEVESSVVPPLGLVDIVRSMRRYTPGAGAQAVDDAPE